MRVVAKFQSGIGCRKRSEKQSRKQSRDRRESKVRSGNRYRGEDLEVEVAVEGQIRIAKQ